MTVNELLSYASTYQYWIAGFFGVLIIISAVISFVITFPYTKGFTHYFASTIVYLASIPGILASTLVFYNFLIIRKNILDLNLIIFFLPIVSMVVVLYLIGRKIKFNRLPGFGRLSGLIVMLTLVCISVLFLYRLHFLIGFFSSIQSLVVIGIVLFFVFKWASKKFMGNDR